MKTWPTAETWPAMETSPAMKTLSEGGRGAHAEQEADA
jgi:hypothetical protein